MARRRGGLLGDLFELAALMPWWVGVALAALVFVGLHLYASAPPDPVTHGRAISADSLLKPIAAAVKHVLAIALLLGAAASAYRQWKRKKNVAAVAGGRTASVLNDMTWREFEMLVSDAFRLRGFSPRETGGGGADGGVDLVLAKGADKYLVQCKQWRASRVGVVPVREFFGVMAAKRAAGGYLVTSGTFTTEAIDFASGRNLELIDGEKLFRMFDEVRASSDIKPAAIPTCPRCGSSMVKRTAQRGASAGADFWGCSAFPRCTGTRPI